MIILVLNSWSSSIKCQIFDMPKKDVLYKTHIDKIWFKWWKFKTYTQAIKHIIQTIDPEILTNIDTIWHRVVHGWVKYRNPTQINKSVLNAIEKYSEFVPLHNPVSKESILICKKLLPKTKQIAVFDTEFYKDIQEANYILPLPYKYYKKYGMRKFWFHGISHEYVYNQIMKLKRNWKIKIKGSKIITCHIWNGASITAIKNWKAISNSLWMTTLSWLVMWTRSGDLDPWSIAYIAKKEKLNPEQIDNILYKESGVFWISWVSNNLKTIVEKSINWNKRCELALDMYINQIIKYVGAYTALLNGINAIIFTWGVLEKDTSESSFIRERIINNFKYLGIKINKKKNKKLNQYWIITELKSKIPIIVIQTNEELAIAQKIYKMIILDRHKFLNKNL